MSFGEVSKTHIERAHYSARRLKTHHHKTHNLTNIIMCFQKIKTKTHNMCFKCYVLWKLHASDILNKKKTKNIFLFEKTNRSKFSKILEEDGLIFYSRNKIPNN